MEIEYLLLELRKRGFSINFKDDSLIVDGDINSLEEETLLKLKNNKFELIEFLKSENQNDFPDSIRPAIESEYYPVTPQQKRLLILNNLNPNSTAYNINDLFELNGRTDSNEVNKACEKLIARHEILRTSFHLINNQLKQKVNSNTKISIDESTISNDELSQIQSSFIRPFELSLAPLFRIKVVHLKSGNDLILLDMHHIICDQVSMEIIKQDFYSLYNNFELKPTPLQYKDYAVWLDDKIHENYGKDTSKQYWLDKFKQKPLPLNLPYDYKRPATFTFNGANVKFLLDEKTTKDILNICAELELTLSMFLLGLFKIMLFKITGQQDICIGMPMAGRNHIDLHDIVGLFVNTLVIRSTPKSGTAVKNYFREIRSLMLKALDHQDYPFEELIDEVLSTRDLSRNPMFDVFFNFLGEFESNGKIEVEELHSSESVKFDLSLYATKMGDNIVLDLNYCVDLFSPASIDRFIGYFKQLAQEVPEKLNLTLSDLQILSKSEIDFLKVRLNQTESVQKDNRKSYKQLFEEQAINTPDNYAVIGNKKKLTYQDLDIESNKLARVLIDKGYGAGKVIGVLFNIDVELIVSMIAIIKTGASFLPISKEFPEKRVKYLLKESKCDLVLTNITDFKNDSIEIIKVEGESLNGNSDFIDSKIQPSDPIYTIFTSGTSGQPKGVSIRHESLVNYLLWLTKKANLSANDRTVLLNDYSYDLGYTVLFSSLITGGELHLLKRDNYLSVNYLIRYCLENKITHLKTTPSFFNHLIDTNKYESFCKSLRLIIFGGEAIDVRRVRELANLNKEIKIINHYGPTESTIGCIAHLIDFNELDKFTAQPVIGTPIDNMKAYVCDQDLNLVPIGVAGELCIAGTGLANGYISDVTQQAKKFIPNPFDGSPMLYRTGDLVKRDSEGNIQFLGRIDSQVKINGYRVEVSEIEKKLLSHPDINEVTIIHDQKDAYLMAFYVSQMELEHQSLKELLMSELPHYMLPSYYQRLDKMPITLNGKIDFNALLRLKKSFDNETSVPITESEVAMSKIWSEALSLHYSEIGVDTNFFAIGGNSLKALALLQKINEEFETDLSIKDIFIYSSIKELLTHIDKRKQIEAAALLEELKSMSSEKLKNLMDE